MDARDEQRFDDWMLKDKIISFNELSVNVDQFMREDYSDWIVSHTAEYICIYLYISFTSC